VLVHTAARAVRLLHAYDFDLISLDFNRAGPDNGAAVARASTASVQVCVSGQPETGTPSYLLSRTSFSVGKSFGMGRVT
jgi:hypothetical protein